MGPCFVLLKAPLASRMRSVSMPCRYQLTSSLGPCLALPSLAHSTLNPSLASPPGASRPLYLCPMRVNLTAPTVSSLWCSKTGAPSLPRGTPCCPPVYRNIPVSSLLQIWGSLETEAGLLSLGPTPSQHQAKPPAHKPGFCHLRVPKERRKPPQRRAPLAQPA